MTQRIPRAVVGALLATIALAACDSRRTTGGGTGENLSPRVTIEVPSANSQNEVLLNTAIGVTVRSTDDLSLLAAVDSVYVDNVLVHTDSVRFSSATPVHTHSFTIPVKGIRSGQIIRIVGAAVDGPGSYGYGMRLLTANDTAAPKVTIDRPAAGTAFKPGSQTDTITVSANDSTGIALIGYRFYSDSLASTAPFGGDSVAVGDAPTSATRHMLPLVPSSTAAGTYYIRGFANDPSGRRGFSAMRRIIVQDTTPPVLTFLPPAGRTAWDKGPPADTLVNVDDDTITVYTRLTDNSGVARLTLVAMTLQGNPDLGPVDTTIVYGPATYPTGGGTLPAGITYDSVGRVLVRQPGVTPPSGRLYVMGILTDQSGNADTTILNLRLVSGPILTVASPAAGETAIAGQKITVQIFATDGDGVKTLGFELIGNPAFVPALYDTLYSSPPTEAEFLRIVDIPSTYPVGTSFTIRPFATDPGGNQGSGASRVVYVAANVPDTVPPRVYQTVPERMELGDSVAYAAGDLLAHGDSLIIRAKDTDYIEYIGYVLRDMTGVTIRRDSALVTAPPNPSDVIDTLYLNLVSSRHQGSKLEVIGFARDTAGHIGYAIPATATVPAYTIATATPDTTLAAYGATYRPPGGGLRGDVAVDVPRNNAFISNPTASRVEVWQGSARAFSSTTVAVGSNPFGLHVNGDTMLVANSGGTNISRVYIAPGTPSSIYEVASLRIKTEDISAWQVTIVTDPMTGTTKYSALRFNYSDRPQYIVQGGSRKIYFSTVPTDAQGDGTIRSLDPTLARTDVHLAWQYGAPTGSDRIGVFHVDWLAVLVNPDPALSDKVEICDHPYGSTAASVCYTGELFSVLSQLEAYGSDVEYPSVSIPSLSLTDTTFVNIGGDRRIVAFGEGAKNGPSRVMIANDQLGSWSSGVSVQDLTGNASDRVFGVAVNSNSTMLAAHGNATFFADVEYPYELRLQGRYDAGMGGAGVDFHPQNNGTGGTDANDKTRVTFVASTDGTNSQIDIIDSFYFKSRGSLPVRGVLYGPLRVSSRFTSDPADVILKVWALSDQGLLVIDVRASDIKDLPTQ